MLDLSSEKNSTASKQPKQIMAARSTDAGQIRVAISDSRRLPLRQMAEADCSMECDIESADCTRDTRMGETVMVRFG